jgi:F-box and WD-40 domain protein 1/11
MDRDSAPSTSFPPLLRLRTRDHRPEFASPSLSASFKLDEGYSDETRSQAENDVKISSGEIMSLPEWILAHSELERAGA